VQNRHRGRLDYLVKPSRTAAGAGSVADLNRAETPAIWRIDAPLHQIAVAVAIVGIAVGVVRIGVVIIIIGVVEAVPYACERG
jgi:hypothetical protein